MSRKKVAWFLSIIALMLVSLVSSLFLVGRSQPGPSQALTAADVNLPTVSPSPTLSVTVLPTMTPTPSPKPQSQNQKPNQSAPTPSNSVVRTWEIQSVDSMKATKDKICSPQPLDWIERWVDKAVELGATHVAISQPYQNPSCGDSLAYTKLWISVIRTKGLKVWHRHPHLAFEGIYNTPKDPHLDYIKLTTDYIKANQGDFQSGDIFTPQPEPQNGGIQGVTFCPNSVCIFNDAASFNSWLRNVYSASKDTLASLGLSGVKVGYFGFDGFVAWGHNNPDWKGKGVLEDSTVKLMGHIAIDHYPEAVGTQMGPDLQELEVRFPGIPIIISEWGTITDRLNPQIQVQNSMGAAAKDKTVVGFNYWTLGPDGLHEPLIEPDFSNRPQFDEVQSFYKPIK